MATTDIKITVPDEVREAMESAARADGKTLDELAVAAFKREISRRFLDKVRREAESRRQGKTDAEIEDIVEHAIREVRNVSRGH